MPINDPIYYNRKDSVPGTGQNVLADALVGFAKGYAQTSEDKRKERNANEQAVVQAMVQNKMIRPTADGNPDFNSLGFGWNYNAGNQGASWTDKNYESQIKDRDLEEMIKTDPEAWVMKNLERAREKYKFGVDYGSIDEDKVSVEMYLEEAEKQLRKRAEDIGYLKPFSNKGPVVDLENKEPGEGKYAGRWLSKGRKNKKDGKTYYKVKDLSTGDEGIVDDETLATSPNYERI